jgi:PAS domain-containing protein
MREGRDLFGQRKDGQQIPIEISLTPIESTEGTFALAAVVDLADRKRTERLLTRQALEARLLHRSVAMSVETERFEEALQRCVDSVCELTGWPVGHVYLPSEGGEVLEPSRIWYSADRGHEVFREVTERTTFAMGIGLPGRIWKSGEPAWIANVQYDVNFPRARLSDDVGVKGAFGFPIKIDSQIVAVLEFFSDKERPSRSDC